MIFSKPYRFLTKVNFIVLLLISFFILSSMNVVFAENVKLLRLGGCFEIDSPRYEMCAKFAEVLSKNTGGRYDVKIFPSSQLGGIRDQLDGLKIGTVDIVMDGGIRLQVYSPLAALFKVPYMVKDLDHFRKVWQSEAGREFYDAVAEESGIIMLGAGYSGASHITSNRPIYGPEDMKGLKIRVPPYDIPIQTFEMVGANPTPMDYQEVYLALQQGVVDAQENPMSDNYPSHFYEVTKYLILTGHVIIANTFMMDQDYFNSLSESDKKDFREAADVACELFSKTCSEQEEYYIDQFRKEGVTVIEPDIEAFYNIWKDLVPTYYPEFVPYVEKLMQAGE